MENRIVFDWLTFTCKEVEEPADLIAFLGLVDYKFELLGGFNGYRQRWFYDGISILFDGQPGMGICVNMSGRGCRVFESAGSGDWVSLLKFIYLSDSVNLTRLDVAYDDFKGILLMDEMLDDVDKHHYISKARHWMVQYGSEGASIYHGSMKSDMLIRIYDKAAEQRVDHHWIRVELQMRRDIATGFLRNVLDLPVGTVFLGVLRNYLRYVVPDDTSNPSRWPMTEYWSELLDGVSAIRCWESPGTEYTMEDLYNFVVNQAGNAIDCYIGICGYESFIKSLGSRSCRPSKKYLDLMEKFKYENKT